MYAVQFFIRDILGMAGGIVFAYAAGSNFDSNAKQWRLFADIMNDIGERLRMLSCTTRKMIPDLPTSMQSAPCNVTAVTRNTKQHTTARGTEQHLRPDHALGSKHQQPALATAA